jgi:hypothetical protein
MAEFNPNDGTFTEDHLPDNFTMKQKREMEAKKAEQAQQAPMTPEQLSASAIPQDTSAADSGAQLASSMNFPSLAKLSSIIASSRIPQSGADDLVHESPEATQNRKLSNL